jgi:signal transduction histidine kinase
VTRDPADTETPSPSPPRVLTFEMEATEFPLARALVAAGLDVETVARPAELATALKRHGYDAVVLDLSTRGMAEEVASAAGATLNKMNASPLESRATVLAVWPSGGQSDPPGRFKVDVTIGTRDVAQVVREVEWAVAARRLGQSLVEIDRLRKTVLFARHTAHELAQPLTTILARAQLLRTKLKPEDPHLRAVDIICEEADRMARMMEEFQKLKVMSRPAAASED